MHRRTRLAAGLGALAVVALGALTVSPARAFGAFAWLAGRPVLFGAALLAAAVVRPLLAWPTSLLPVAAGYAYGLAGVPVAVLLMVVSAVPPYEFARWVGGPDDRSGGGGTGRGDAVGGGRGLGARFADEARRAAEGVAGTTRGVAAGRLLPLPSDAVSAGAGAARIRRRPFLLGTAVGETPWALAGVYAGATVASLRSASLGAVLDPAFLAVGAFAALLLLAGPTYRRLSGRAVSDD